MSPSSTDNDSGARYELRFPGLFNSGRGYVFRCNADGQVDIDALSEAGRTNYFCARAVVGCKLSVPVTHRIGAAPDRVCRPRLTLPGERRTEPLTATA